ncbi:MAG: hypothetical protein SOX56_07100 [[Pasteurella] mairii]|uniref:Leucine transcriptional activator n=1 Tax=[Pasteurella] mairii TaxID=757 RepID=A0A379B682_9PAST|nr:hypothetical protein [[Pasteurella] mairii]SUB34097.1 leucine transcriptional activator [[Pasteurella] mairii]
MSKTHPMANQPLALDQFCQLPFAMLSYNVVAVLPEHLAKTLPNVHLQSPPIEVKEFTMMMAWHERTEQDIAHQWIQKTLLEVVKRVK